MSKHYIHVEIIALDECTSTGLKEPYSQNLKNQKNLTSEPQLGISVELEKNIILVFKKKDDNEAY